MTVFLVFIVAGIASISDVRTYRIPNWLTFGAILVGFILNFYLTGITGLLVSFWGFIVGGLALLPFFMLGGMGAGDVKLIAGFGALGGPMFAMNALLTGSLFGGLAALLILVRKYGCKDFFARLFLLMKFKGTQENSILPYGVYISAGALLSCFWGVF